MADTNRKISRINLNGDYSIDVASELKDATPTHDSQNVVTSDGIAKALDLKLEKKPDGSNELINEDGKINMTYLSDSALGQVKFGGIFSSGVITQTSAILKDFIAQEFRAQYPNLEFSTSSFAGSDPELAYENGNAYLRWYEDYSLNGYIDINVEGFYFIVSADCTFAEINFATGDWLLASGGKWAKVDNTDAVTSVNGQTGNVTIEQVQADWNENNTSSAAYIKNRTHYTKNDGTVIQLDAKFIPVDNNTIKVENGKLVGAASATNLDLSNVNQDVNIVGDHSLNISGDLNIDGALGFGYLKGTTIEVDYLKVAAEPEEDTDVVNKAYFDSHSSNVDLSNYTGDVNIDGNVAITGDLSFDGDIEFASLSAQSIKVNGKRVLVEGDATGGSLSIDSFDSTYFTTNAAGKITLNMNALLTQEW